MGWNVYHRSRVLIITDKLSHIINGPNNLTCQQEGHPSAEAIEHLYRNVNGAIYCFWCWLLCSWIIFLISLSSGYVWREIWGVWNQPKQLRLLYACLFIRWYFDMSPTWNNLVTHVFTSYIFLLSTWATEVAVTLSEGGNHTAEMTRGPEPIWDSNCFKSGAIVTW